MAAPSWGFGPEKNFLESREAGVLLVLRRPFPAECESSCSRPEVADTPCSAPAADAAIYLFTKCLKCLDRFWGSDTEVPRRLLQELSGKLGTAVWSTWLSSVLILSLFIS